MPQRHPRLYAVLSLAAVGLLGLTACSSGKSSTGAASPSAQPVKGGTLRLYGEGDVDYMDTADGYYDVTYTLMSPGGPQARRIHNGPGAQMAADSHR
jgi:hypothetical protein